MSNDGVSICITAYNVKEYIKECLDSVVNQTWFKTHDDWEIIVGVDGCEKTLEYLKTIMHNYKNLRVFMMDSNKGTYITSNTIMSNATYNNVFRFDSDDIMLPNLVETIMNKKDENVLVRYKMKNFGNGSSLIAVAHGTIYIKKSIFLKYGGFRPWPCGADTEIYYRLSKIEKVKEIPDILMLRRVHTDSLFHSKETGKKSELRKKYKKMIKEEVIKKPEDAMIECIKNTYTEIKSSLVGTIDQDEYIKSLKSISTNVVDILPQKITPLQNTKKPVSAVIKLRQDIAAGRVIKVPTINGYIWKRVK